jgi:hypothetical protein
MLKHRIARVTFIASAVAAVAMVSVASGALKTKSASTTVGAGDTGSASAKCKKGSVAVSGGFDNPGFDPTLPFDVAIFNFASSREGKRTWTAAGLNNGSNPGQLIADAYCDKAEPKLKKASTTVTVEDESTATATAKCKRGSEAVAGGYASDDPAPNFHPFRSNRDGKRKWTVEVYKFFTGTDSELTVFAYCDKREPKLKAKSAQTEVIADDAGSATATCKRGTEAVSGGLDGPDADPAGLVGAAIYPYQSQRTGKREWTVSGWNDEETGTLVAYAYCKKK